LASIGMPPAQLYRSSVGRKLLMALSGVVLLGFVVVHMLGNLKIFFGAKKFDAYAEFLREVGAPVLGHGQALWIARAVLLACVGVHVVAAVQLALASYRARRTRNVRQVDLSFSYASRTMRWGGAIVLAFVVYHLLHLTTGTLHPGFDARSAYANVVRGFRVWPVAAAYVLAMAPLCLHIYHGMWSATQTLALRHPALCGWCRPAAGLVAAAVFLGNVSVPLAVWVGWVE
jgi:succinate dehydrogenase / fumarate reductase cytochrome b subunit